MILRAATVLALIFAIFAAYALARHRFPGKEATVTILELPIIGSPAALGAIILIFNNPLGAWLQEHTVYFVFHFAGIVLGQR